MAELNNIINDNVMNRHATVQQTRLEDPILKNYFNNDEVIDARLHLVPSKDDVEKHEAALGHAIFAEAKKICEQSTSQALADLHQRFHDLTFLECSSMFDFFTKLSNLQSNIKDSGATLDDSRITAKITSKLKKANRSSIFKDFFTAWDINARYNPGTAWGFIELKTALLAQYDSLPAGWRTAASRLHGHSSNPDNLLRSIYRSSSFTDALSPTSTPSSPSLLIPHFDAYHRTSVIGRRSSEEMLTAIRLL